MGAEEGLDERAVGDEEAEMWFLPPLCAAVGCRVGGAEFGWSGD